MNRGGILIDGVRHEYGVILGLNKKRRQFLSPFLVPKAVRVSGEAREVPGRQAPRMVPATFLLSCQSILL